MSLRGVRARLWSVVEAEWRLFSILVWEGVSVGTFAWWLRTEGSCARHGRRLTLGRGQFTRTEAGETGGQEDGEGNREQAVGEDQCAFLVVGRFLHWESARRVGGGFGTRAGTGKRMQRFSEIGKAWS